MSAMELIFDTTLSEGTEISIPLADSVSVTIDWGDGNSDPFTTMGFKHHEYATEGTYTVSIKTNKIGIG